MMEEASIANQGLMEVVRDSQTLPLINNLRRQIGGAVAPGTHPGGTPVGSTNRYLRNTGVQ